MARKAKQTPRILQSTLTNQWYVVTRYHYRAKGGIAVFIADIKYDVTDQMKEILQRECGRTRKKKP